LKITIAIPTFNRIDHLKCAIDAIQKLNISPKIHLALSISNIASDDGTSDFLKSLSINNLELHISNTKKKEIHSNWYNLTHVIPADTDYVWLHGDDDTIINENALKHIHEIIHSEPTINSIIIPQAKRLKGTNKRYISTLSDLCMKFGFHEMLGWMSQIITTRDTFINAMKGHGEKIGDARSGTDLTRRRVSAFQHSSEFLKLIGNKTAALLDSHIIDEQDQVFSGIRTRQEARAHQNVRDLFFFVPESLDFLHNDLKNPLDVRFFRYVNKSLGDLLVNICLDDICNQRDPTLSVAEKIQILRNLHQIINDCQERRDLGERIEFISSIYLTLSNKPRNPATEAQIYGRAMAKIIESRKPRYSEIIIDQIL
jgi:hypothetical protein